MLNGWKGRFTIKIKKICIKPRGVGIWFPTTAIDKDEGYELDWVGKVADVGGDGGGTMAKIEDKGPLLEGER